MSISEMLVMRVGGGGVKIVMRGSPTRGWCSQWRQSWVPYKENTFTSMVASVISCDFFGVGFFQDKGIRKEEGARQCAMCLPWCGQPLGRRFFSR
jgi:hypothetical protein